MTKLEDNRQQIEELLKTREELQAKLADLEANAARRDAQAKFEGLRKEWDRAVQAERSRSLCSSVMAVQRASARLPNLRRQYVRAYNALHRSR